ncbi:MAG: hypothetical protein Q9M48_08100 [Rhodobacterales bacterium]|nr:hypothetical protein [Rhodobacterales bacterium]
MTRPTTLRKLFVFALILPLLAACGRSLSEGEQRFAGEIHGDQINPDKVRFHNGALIGQVTFFRPARPRLACRERIFPAPKSEMVTVSAAAVSLFNQVYFRRSLFLRDFMKDYPNKMYLLDAMLFSHEMTHVWQWQNRAVTGYHPLKAAAEHSPGGDPYLFDLSTNARFLDYSYEQQGGIVEEYVCCRTLAPNATRTKRLHDMLSGAFPVQALESRLAATEVIVPWKGVEIKGICG